MQTFPLITHDCVDDVLAWQASTPITAGRFLSDVAALCAALHPGRYMLNACMDRYRFTVGFAAALVTGRICLLPSTQTPETIRQLLLFAPDAFCLTDSDNCTVAMPKMPFPALPAEAGEPAGAAKSFAAPQIDAAQTVAYVFTSGSTGAPVPHRKTWGALVRNVRAEAELCGLNDGRRHAVIGTVPAQHMYGFESTVLIALQSANAIVSGKSFFPADICHAVECAPRPRMLVSTPVHLRSVVSSGLSVPPVDLLVCATAPLSLTLANELEARFSAPLLEIYGSTETGQIAMRQSTQTPQWQLFPQIELRQEGGVTFAAGGHVEQPTPLNDVIEIVTHDRFLLHGRTADLINIAGKRSSLAHLNLQLNAIPGVEDGAFFMPDDVEPDGVTRLAAFVVAPHYNAAMLMKALRERVDPAFLPRPLVFVETLPRNATGKLPREALKALLERQTSIRAAA